MIYAVLSNYLVLLSIFGYSLLSRNILCKNYNSKINNLDLFYGFIFLIFLSLLINFFFPLKYFTLPIIIIGLIFFFKGLKFKKFDINLIYYFLVIFFITWIAFYGRDNVDSPMYHLQIIKWITEHKISFGITNLEIRFGVNSSWHSILSLLNVSYEKFSSKYYFSAIIFSVTLYEIFRIKTQNNSSFIFLYLFFCYLFLFSYLHPIYYGIILNHLGNPDMDIASMFLYFFTFYIFIKTFEEKEFNDKKKNLINILVISSFVCVTTRFTNIFILLLPLYVFIKNKDYKIFNNLTIIFTFIVGLLWMVRSFFLSGCLIFPVVQTCLETSWSPDKETIIYFVDEAKRFTRTLPYLNGVNDYDYTINSYRWLKPWIKDYLFTTALLQINILIIIATSMSFILKIIYSKVYKRNFFLIDIHEKFIIFVILLSLIIWMITPEIRYAWGLLFVFPCFFITLFTKNFLFKIIEKTNKKLIFTNLIVIFCIFFSKNVTEFKSQDIFSLKSRDRDFSKFQKIGTFNDYHIFFNKWMCFDFKGICVNTIKKNYLINKKYSYLFFK